MTREDELEAFAAGEGWAFEIEDPFGLLDLPFRFLENGIGRSIGDVITGIRNGVEFVAFDFEYAMIAGGALQVPETLQASCAVAAIAADCPELMISHETLTHWLEHPVHHEVFEHESAEFAKRFRVTTTDTSFAEALLDKPVEEWFLRQEPDHDLCFEIRDTWLMCFTRLRPADEVMRVIDGLTELRASIPEAVYERWGTVERDRDTHARLTRSDGS